MGAPEGSCKQVGPVGRALPEREIDELDFS